MSYLFRAFNCTTYGGFLVCFIAKEIHIRDTRRTLVNSVFVQCLFKKNGSMPFYSWCLVGRSRCVLTIVDPISPRFPLTARSWPRSLSDLAWHKFSTRLHVGTKNP